MKKLIILFSAAVFLLMSCEDKFLDLQDLDSVTEIVFFDNPQDFEDGANDFYSGLHSPKASNPGTGDNDGFAEISDYGTELNGYAQDFGQGVNNPTFEDLYWKNAYWYLRDINTLIKKGEEYVANGGSASEISESIATAYFFRAYHHFRLLKRFGGAPIMTVVAGLDDEVLDSPRNSRYELVTQVLADLDLAIAGLPETAVGPDLGKISSIAATAYKARVLLFEGTWEKYVGTVTDFEGSGGPTVTADAYIAQAVTAAKEVIDSGAFEIWNQNADPLMENNSYKWLFSLEGADSNPGGYTKASNKEFIIQSIFDHAANDQIRSQFTQINESRNSATQVALDMYSTTDGLPLVDKNDVAINSPLFEGYAKQSDQFENRDRRMWANFGGGTAPVEGSNAILAISNVNNSNLSNQKFTTWNKYRSVREESYNYPHLRYGEILLTYAEALFERDGSISDGDLDLSVNLLRNRAGIAPLTNALVTSNDLDMLDEIRRERTVELYMEDNNHWNDIRRWNTAVDLLSNNIIGAVIEGTEYETNSDLFDPSTAIYGFVDDYPSGVGPVRALIIDPASFRTYNIKNYLWPLPLEELVLSPSLKQNPGW
ncbi:RagB/SusD family nutrient uptake outer membrane protein [Zobellia nedashkovskayae]|uniref:RagB/SusD family nutrient uptake outer membrane protein n=1 Tax=Zobellia nedashkovskayae TaxID=2779510 RepID=UPI00188B377F|nr:RagB/SusD family nutrient uptake outer membrane protein [Zobellia nedashkovskayae]